MNSTDPLYKNYLPLYEAMDKGVLNNRIVEKLDKKKRLIANLIEKIERASKVRYPYWFISPYALLMTDPTRMQEAILYSRLMPIIANDGRLNLTVEITSPLLLLASKETLQAALAHEFLHYTEFSRRINNFSIQNTGVLDTLYESLYKDPEDTIEPHKIFGRYKSLIKLLEAKFAEGLSDEVLNKKVINSWIMKSLPVKRITPEENVANIPINAIINYKVDTTLQKLLERV